MPRSQPNITCNNVQRDSKAVEEVSAGGISKRVKVGGTVALAGPWVGYVAGVIGGTAAFAVSGVGILSSAAVWKISKINAEKARRAEEAKPRKAAEEEAKNTTEAEPRRAAEATGTAAEKKRKEAENRAKNIKKSQLINAARRAKTEQSRNEATGRATRDYGHGGAGGTTQEDHPPGRSPPKEQQFTQQPPTDGESESDDNGDEFERRIGIWTKEAYIGKRVETETKQGMIKKIKNKQNYLVQWDEEDTEQEAGAGAMRLEMGESQPPTREELIQKLREKAKVKGSIVVKKEGNWGPGNRNSLLVTYPGIHMHVNDDTKQLRKAHTADENGRVDYYKSGAWTGSCDGPTWKKISAICELMNYRLNGGAYAGMLRKENHR